MSETLRPWLFKAASGLARQAEEERYELDDLPIIKGSKVQLIKVSLLSRLAV